MGALMEGRGVTLRYDTEDFDLFDKLLGVYSNCEAVSRSRY